jgi:hypothetical protein
MNNFRKKFFYLFLFFFFVIGSITSLNVGISHDEYHEEENWKFNQTLTKDISNKIFSGEVSNFKKEGYRDRYYGIGFQIVSQPIQFFLKDLVIKHQQISEYGSKLVSKHFVVFLFFFISGICFYLIQKKIIKNKYFCYFSTLIYLLYPYLLGHSFFNPKDIPFMSTWLLCTYISFNFFEKIIKDNFISFYKIFIFSFVTAFLLSIRITGVLIFLQYVMTFIIFINIEKINFYYFVKKFYKKIITFTILLFLITYILSPIYWSNPLEIINAIKSMSYYYHDVCTETLGECMSAKNLPATYVPIWLSVKLPLLIIIGIFLIPFAEKKIFIDKKKSMVFGTILISTILIPVILILSNTNLYDEIRHLMFLMPFFFILGSVSFYIFSKKLFYLLGILTISIFIYENIKIHPYQYVWFNLPSRFIDLTNNFELEYQGLSGKEISKEITKNIENDICILTSPIYSVEPFLNKGKFNCYDIWQYVDAGYQRPFLAIQHVRNIKKGMPYNCDLIFESSFNLLFHKKKFVAGKLLRCT